MVPGRAGRPLRGVVLGTGRAGAEIMRLAARSPVVELVGAIVADPAKVGRDLGEIAGIGPLGIVATDDVAAVLARADVDVVFYCGSDDPAALRAHATAVVAAGKDLVTVSGPFHFPRALGEADAAELARQAQASGSRVVGAGLNPGFALDALVAAVSAVCVAPTRVRARRVADVRSWGAGALAKLGIGSDQPRAGTVAGMDLGEPVAIVADALGIALDAIETDHRSLPAASPREHDGLVVAAGQVGGFRITAAGIAGGERLIELEWMGIFCLDPEADGGFEPLEIDVEGEGGLSLRAGGACFEDAYAATAIRAINVAPALARLAPGIYRPDELAVTGRWMEATR